MNTDLLPSRQDRLTLEQRNPDQHQHDVQRHQSEGDEQDDRASGCLRHQAGARRMIGESRT
jgi:hypothetical protein